MNMENLKTINWKERERELENLFSDRFRKMWIQYTRLGSVCITAFPLNQNETYQIFTSFKMNDFSLENLKNIVLSNIEN